MLRGEEGVADHPRNFQPDRIVYVPWRRLSVRMKKPRAWRNGAPFKDGDLPAAPTQARAETGHTPRARRPFVKLGGAALDHGLGAMEAACAEALEAALASGDVILSVLARRRQPASPPSIATPHALRLKIKPAPDCSRYDRLRKIA